MNPSPCNATPTNESFLFEDRTFGSSLFMPNSNWEFMFDPFTPSKMQPLPHLPLKMLTKSTSVAATPGHVTFRRAKTTAPDSSISLTSPSALLVPSFIDCDAIRARNPSSRVRLNALRIKYTTKFVFPSHA